MTGLEKELFNSIKEGNEKAFELFFKSWYKRLCVFAYGYTRQMETAEDIVKDLFVHFWNNRKKLEIKTSISGYLFRSVRNSCINYIERDKQHKKTISLEEANWLQLKMKEPFSEDFPPGNLMLRELEEEIYKEIEKLPEACREIFKLSRFDGLSHKKIAKQLNISENTVKVQIYRALKDLKNVFSRDTFLLFALFLKK